MPDNSKQINIPADIAARYEDAGQFEHFDKEFRRVAENTGSKEPAAKKPKGRPKKSKR